MKRAHPAAVAHWVKALAFALSIGACRKAAPDERVYQGRSNTPGTPPVGSGGSAGNPGSGGTGADPTAFSKAALLGAVADCAIDRYREFRDAAAVLDDTARTAAASAAPSDVASMRQAWLVAMAKWEQVELFRFGPMARLVDPGGRDIRDRIDGWPLVSRCGIEERIVSRAYDAPELSMALINVRGLAAFEYVAFYEGSDNACSNFTAINAHGTWAALGAAEIARRKLEYAAASAKDVRLQAEALVEAWSPTGGNFRAELLGAAQRPTFGSEQKALNAVSDALFYIEIEGKDWKLGRPVGLGDCAAPTCPDALESPYARQSTAHLQNNLAGFRLVFEGCAAGNSGTGFDDWLRAAGASDLADRMLAALEQAENAVATLDPPIEQALATDPAKVMGVYTAFKGLTDLLKTEFVTVLNLELPKPAQGDND
ncbi:MAG TPA: imelysin family protein [Polyangiaceae bacterium]|nr:imelysin family protein [Polyangiaceae bacterium]